MEKKIRKSMKALIWDGKPYPEGLYQGNVLIPIVKPDWVLIQNIATGICGSDLHYLSGKLNHQIPSNNFPAVLGHENAGIVVEVGEGVDEFNMGDRVVGEPLHPCVTQNIKLCRNCEVGNYHLCNNLGHIGIPARLNLPGGFGEYSIYHKNSLFRIPDHVSFEEASILDVTACGVHAINISQVHPGDKVVVLGLGAIGLSIIQCLKAVGVTEIFGVTPFNYQEEIALNLGAKEIVCFELGEDPTQEILRKTDGVDIVFEAVGGNADTMNQAIEICKNGAKIVMAGFFEGIRPINLHKVFLKELSILASDGYSMWGNQREFDLALKMVSNGQISNQSLITHTFDKYEEWEDAFKAAYRKQEFKSIKVVINTQLLSEKKFF